MLTPETSPSRPKDLLEALTLPGVLPVREANALRAWASTFYPFQREWLFESERFAVCNKSRQIGMSHTTAAAAVLWGVFLGENTTVVSVGEREALEILDKAKRHAKVLTLLGSKWAGNRPLAKELEFENGAKILALPSSSGGRGYSGNSFLDEFAYAENPTRLWDGASGTTMHGYRMRVASTPNGVGNMFHNLWSDPKAGKGWVRHEFPLQRAISEGMVVNIEQCWSMARGDPRLFAQMFECSFLDGDQQYIPTDLIRAAAIDERSMLRIEGFAYAGLDIGLVNDLTSLTVLKQDAFGRMYEQETRTCKRTSWEDQEAMVLAAHDEWDFRRICVDRTGLGRVPSERLEKLLGPHRVESVDFTLESKDRMATGLFQAFNNRTIQIRDDVDLIRDLCSMRRIVTSAGNIRYDTPRTVHGHGDRAWSLALAVLACSPYGEGRPGTRTDYGDGDYQNT